MTTQPQEQNSEDYPAYLHQALGGETRTAAKAADFFLPELTLPRPCVV